jgi:hypothetical protein
MYQEIPLIGIDLANASELLIELLIEDAMDPSIYMEIAKANLNRREILDILLENPETPEDVKRFIIDSKGFLDKPKVATTKIYKTPEQRQETIFQRIQRLSVSERILLALRGGKDVRTLLLRDPNKEVALTVLQNPKITETEVEIVAKSRSVPEELLRKIAKKREWIKNYNIVLALVTNPKTPANISLSLVNDLRTKDLALLEKNKNVSEGLRAMAKKLLRARKAH